MADKYFEQRNTEPLPDPELNEGFSILDRPREVGNYKIESLLQRSGMSLIYLATEPNIKLPVAVKVLLPKLSTQKDIVERFLREAKILSVADHPNIVKMYKHGTWEGGHYIAMEFIMGGSLRQYILQNPISLKRALEIILEISYAVCHLHTHGIIHRDLKLENILITEKGEIKLIDFGIAQLLGDVKNEERSVFQYRTMGTPIYMSPEQRENPEDVSYPSDIYSLGIIAYELVLGRLSQGHVHLSLMPKGMQKILAKALQPQPQKRYQDIVDFIADISAYLGSQALQDERTVGDRTNELFDSLQKAKKVLFSLKAPSWPKLKIGLAASITSVEAGAYGDFFQLDEEAYAIFIGSPIASDAEGIIASATMRGRVRAIAGKQGSLSELINVLNRMLLEDPLEQPFSLCCLTISSIKQQASYISCGYGTLWRIPNGENLPQRIFNENGYLKTAEMKCEETTCRLESGDQLFLYGAKTCDTETESLLVQGIIEFADLPPQEKAEGILRKLKLSAPNEFEHHFVVAIIQLL